MYLPARPTILKRAPGPSLSQASEPEVQVILALRHVHGLHCGVVCSRPFAGLRASVAGAAADHLGVLVLRAEWLRQRHMVWNDNGRWHCAPSGERLPE